MRLIYYKGNNFGDELSPFIFNKLLPNFFNDDATTLFYGIGSILGEQTFKEKAKRIIFSSGFGNYNGAPPKIDKDSDVICVRGPITAELLKIDKSKAVTDGALLLKSFDFPEVEKKYDFSFIPHWVSELKYPWKELCNEAGIHFISPMGDLDEVLTEIRKSKTIITEAMHGAIVADVFRIPWVPAKTYKDKYDIKWRDWTESLNLEFEPNKLHGLYDNTEFVVDKIKSSVNVPKGVIKGLIKTYKPVQNILFKSANVSTLSKLKSKKPFLSSDSIIESKFNILLEKIEDIKNNYEA
ncbi:MAG: polysaccharide pyruvyl transferase family protein [Bacteroidota bacterium]